MNYLRMSVLRRYRDSLQQRENMSHVPPNHNLTLPFEGIPSNFIVQLTVRIDAQSNLWSSTFVPIESLCVTSY